MLQAVILAILVGLTAAEFDPELHAKYLTMTESAFIEYFNNQDYSWKIAEYDHVEDEHIACAHINKDSFANVPVLTHDLEGIVLPDNFDAREQWPQCESIKDIFDQESCGSCWTFGTAMTASDRTCIHKDIHVRLSEEDFECLQKKVCYGGPPDRAFTFWESHGLVSRECKPYNVTELEQDKCVTECVNTDRDYKKDKHFAELIYLVTNDRDQIKAELVKNGPIQASFSIYQDLKFYKTGIYVHSYGRWQGNHSVRIIGYGVENGTEYWLVANSWGTSWGEQGLFKIKAYQEDIKFEDELVTGVPKN